MTKTPPLTNNTHNISHIKLTYSPLNYTPQLNPISNLPVYALPKALRHRRTPPRRGGAGALPALPLSPTPQGVPGRAN